MSAFPTEFWVEAAAAIIVVAVFISGIILAIFWLWEHRR